jgi:hypothetical protein
MYANYIEISTAHPFISAFIQFGILGTAGELIANRLKIISTRTALKALGWGLLGIYIKLMFMTASAGLDAFAHYGFTPGILLGALLKSTLMNVMLGPSMMILHRIGDNAIDRAVGIKPLGWTGIDKSLKTLLWLWIPLHTFTFTQKPEIRVGLAAMLSLVLGIVMGYTSRRKTPPN